MLFNSIDFAIFLPIVFGLYWFVFNKGLRWQNALIVSASYLFYGWWDWRFLVLIIFSTLVDYWVGTRLSVEEDSRKRRLLLAASVISNLGLLAFFKYYNFFVSSFVSGFSLFGVSIPDNSLNIILPVGISFYTFQTLSYTIDVYRRDIKPTSDFIAFSAFVGFFPQLVAGPIERAANLLPQFQTERRFDYTASIRGLRQILWGLFKKVVIADNCAKYANIIFNHSENYDGSTLLLGAVFFAFQIYGDFSGYSDIAIGTSRLFGINLTQNFAFPYFSRNIAEFWKRWHISLTSWFRDYVYIPLGGSKRSRWVTVRNIVVVFAISGLWHGAQWKFVVWGVINAVLFLPLQLLNKKRQRYAVVANGKVSASVREVFSMIFTFSLVATGWIFFRADDVSHAISYCSDLFSPSLFHLPDLASFKGAGLTMVLVLLFIVLEWLGREDEFAIERYVSNWPVAVRWTFYCLIIFSVGVFMQVEESPFIYFQF